MNDCIEGAKACREALRAITATNWGDGSQTDNEYFARRDAAISTILATAGPLSPRAAGAMAVLAEFIVCIEQEQTTICLGSKWKPWAAMTAAEQRESRDEFAEI